MPAVPLIALALAVISLIIWIVLTFFRGAFWQLYAFDDDRLPAGSLASWPRVVAIVPARDEADSIAAAVDSLARQDYPGEFQVVLVDDHSADATAALAARAAADASASQRVRIHPAAELPSGWTGKLWAMQQGIEAAAPLAPDFFWFTDADIAHAPDTLRRLAARGVSQRLDLASLMVLLQARSFPERLLIPPFLYFFLKLYPPRWIADSSSKMAGAAGGCVLIRREALERFGGLAAMRDAVIDDCALARRVKQTGGGVWMGVTRRSVSLRAYTTFGEIRDLIARTAYTQLEYSSLLLLGTILGMILTYLVPVALSFHPAPHVWRTALAAWALMIITFLPTLRFYRLSPLWAPLLPIAAAFYTWSTWLSAWRFWRGKGGQWKGRAQAPKS